MGGVVSVRIFGDYVSLPLLLLMLAEAAIHVGAVYLAWTVRFLDIHFHLQSTTGESLWLFPRALPYALVMLGMMTAFGLRVRIAPTRTFPLPALPIGPHRALGRRARPSPLPM